MHTLIITETEVSVVAPMANGYTKLFSFTPEQIDTALALVNYLNGGDGNPLGQLIVKEEVEIHRGIINEKRRF